MATKSTSFASCALGSLLAFLASLASTSVAGAGLDPAMRARMLDSGRVGAALVEELETSPRVRAVVVFAIADAGLDAEKRSPRARASIARARSAIENAMDEAEVAVLRGYDTVNAIAVEASAKGLASLAERAEVVRIDLDTPGSGALAQAIPLAGMSSLPGLGLTGAGTTVAILDSGIDSDHADLADALVDEQCFCALRSLSVLEPCCPDGSASQSGAGSAEDDHGHGTNVTGIVASRGAVAAAGGAAEAEVIAVKVLSSANFGVPSDWLAGLDWLVVNHPEVDAVNMSLGITFGFSATPCDDSSALAMSFSTAVANLRAGGTVVAAASHNQASATGIAFPSCLADVVSVGAVYDANLGPRAWSACTDPSTAPDQVTCFTNTGPNLDLVAPGSELTAPGLGGGLSTFSGTSQATPMVAACALLLRQFDADASAQEIENALRSSPSLVHDAKSGLDFPRLDCTASLAWLDGCPDAPRGDCRTSASASLLYKDDASNDARDTLAWKWNRGAETLLASLADPTSSTFHSLCVYAGPAGEEMLEALLPPDPVRWKALGGGKGFKYKDRFASAAGIKTALVKAGTAGKARLMVRAKGLETPDLATPFATPITVQLTNRDTNVCWTSTFESGDLTANLTGLVRATRRE